MLYDSSNCSSLDCNGSRSDKNIFPSCQYACRVIIATLLMCGGYVAEASSSKTSEVANKLLEKILVKELNSGGFCLVISFILFNYKKAKKCEGYIVCILCNHN